MGANPVVWISSVQLCYRITLSILFFKKCEIPGLFFVYFRLFKQTLQFLQQIYVKNVHPVYGAGILTHDLQDLSLLP